MAGTFLTAVFGWSELGEFPHHGGAAGAEIGRASPPGGASYCSRKTISPVPASIDSMMASDSMR